MPRILFSLSVRRDASKSRMIIYTDWQKRYFSSLKERTMKIILWVIAIIFIVGLLTITGVFKLIF